MAEPDSLANVETLWAKEANTEGLKKAPVGERRKCPFQSFLTLFFWQKLLVGLKADLKNDDKIKEDLAKRNEVKSNSKWKIV